jgi:type I restriction enzyme R subunit
MSPVTQEDKARENIDNLLIAAGWQVFDADQANITARRGVAIREFPLPGHGFADYLLYVDGKAAGVIEAKKEGVTLTGVETQSDKYSKGLPQGLPRWGTPLPFSYQSTGVETRFTNRLDPAPRSRPVFAFHKPETLADILDQCGMHTTHQKDDPNQRRVHSVHQDNELPMVAEDPSNYATTGTFLSRLQCYKAPVLKAAVEVRFVESEAKLSRRLSVIREFESGIRASFVRIDSVREVIPSKTFPKGREK